MFNRFRDALAAAVAFVLIGQAVPALAQPAGTIVDQWVAQMNATPNMIADYEAQTVAGDTVTVTGFTIIDRVSGNGVLFDTLTLSGYRTLPPTGYAFDSLTIDRGQARFDNAEVQIVNVSVRNLNVPESVILFVPDRPFSSIVDMFARATEVAIEEIAIGRLDIAQSAGGLNSVVSYHNYIIRGVANGRIATTTAGPLIMEAPSPDALVRITVGRLESENIDLNAFVNAFDTDRFANGVGDNQWMAMLGHAAYRDILLDAPGAQMRIRAIEIDDFRLRQSDRPIEAALDTLLGNPDMPAREAEVLANTMVVDLLAPYGLGRLSIQGVDLFTDELARFHLGEIYINDLSLDGLGEFGFADLDVVISGGEVLALDHFAIGGIVFPDRAILRAAATAEGKGETIPDLGALLPRLGYIELAGLEVGGPGALPITVERASFRVGGYVGMVPTAYSLEIRGFGAPLTLLDDEIARILNQLGYTDAQGDFAIDVAWDEATETLALNDLYIALVGAGSIRANLQITGITRDMMTNPEAMAAVDPDQFRLAGAQILVTDETVADRLFQWTAEGTDTPAAQYRDEFIRGLPFLLPLIGIPQTVATQIAPPLQQFLRAPGTLAVTVAPLTPIPFDMLMEAIESPTGFLQLLGIQITTVPGAN